MKKTKVTDIVYKPFADQIIKLMEVQIKNPKKRWDAPFNNLNSRPMNAKTKNVYRGINAMMTTFDTYFNKYKYCLYATKKQWASLGNAPKAGEKPLPIIFYKPLMQESKVDPTRKVQAGALLLYSKGYNFAQTEGDYTPPVFKTGKQYSIDAIDQFVKSTKVEIKHKEEGRCYYNQTSDFINMTSKINFKDTKEADATVHYYSVLFHELTHATGHESRTGRMKKNAEKYSWWNRDNYAFEELVAELGSVLFGQQFNIEKTIRGNHIQYLNSWIKALKTDYTLIADASAQAQKAVDFFAVK
jgi:antirestriction protein ArdC